MGNRYDDDSIIVIRDDIDKIRQRPEQYIGYRHWDAFKHLIKEIIQNAIDEAASDIAPGDNKCDEIIVDYDERTKCIIIIDNGRGIPLKSLYDICTVIQSSGKFNKGNKKSAYRLAAGNNCPL